MIIIYPHSTSDSTSFTFFTYGTPYWWVFVCVEVQCCWFNPVLKYSVAGSSISQDFRLTNTNVQFSESKNILIPEFQSFGGCTSREYQGHLLLRDICN